ncbi:BrnT family toxin [Rhodopseudomonas palustris]|uniref:BrnT family toxin n=1 Tax=Rhodopseudomonas palustris TaxID=1076 RepID=UPI0032E0321B
MPLRCLPGSAYTYPTTGDYGELRIITVGLLRGRMVIVVWTPRSEARHIFSMRKANDREKATFGQRLAEG